MTSRPKITREVNAALTAALANLHNGEYETALVYADVLRVGGFRSAASRIRAMVAKEQSKEKEPRGHDDD